MMKTRHFTLAGFSLSGLPIKLCQTRKIPGFLGRGFFSLKTETLKGLRPIT
jgi:hypothetical protein